MKIKEPRYIKEIAIFLKRDLRNLWDSLGANRLWDEVITLP
jgi:hypothetical protein